MVDLAEVAEVKPMAAPAAETMVVATEAEELSASPVLAEEVLETPPVMAEVESETIAAMEEVVPVTLGRPEEVVEPLAEVAEIAPIAAVRPRIAAGPVLVGSEPLQVWVEEENFEEEPVIAFATGTLHEKMTPKLSARRGATPPDGDVRMARKTSWIHRLLGRDEEQVVSMVPEDDNENEVETSVEGSAQAIETVEADRHDEDYDLPLEDRLNQISRQRQVAPLSRGARLSIVPQERESSLESLEEGSLSDGSEPGPVEQAEVADVMAMEAEVAHRPAVAVDDSEIWPDGAKLCRVSDVILDSDAGIRVAADPKLASPGVVERESKHLPPRRPLSFPQLSEMAQRNQPTEVAAALEIEEVHPDLPGLMEQDVELVGQSEALIASAASQASNRETDEAALIEAVAASLEALGALAEQTVGEKSNGIHAVVRQEELETYDVSPLYQESSGSLRIGRWDPIPPLRPAGETWRDRPSPVPTSKPVVHPDRGRWAGMDEDVKTPTRWVPEPEPRLPELLPEPTLTRQWGLLSRFQQARISSTRRVVEESNSERDALAAGSSNGNADR